MQFFDNSYINGTPATSSYVRNSTGKGWYSNNYRTGNPSHLTGIDVDANASNKVKNIYDMAGNVREWTMETYNTSFPNGRVYRGGNYSDDDSGDPVSSRVYNSPASSTGYIGIRLALYL